MIARVWHGWTAPGNAEAYETLLKTEIFPGIFAKNVPGFEGLELYRRDLGQEVEFVTTMRFASLVSRSCLSRGVVRLSASRS